MNLPFSIEEFFEILREYNTSVFPAQIILNILALAIIILAVFKMQYSDKLISYGLAALWLWMGVVYHYIFFTRINPAANIFAIFFVLQGLIFIYSGVIKSDLSFSFKNSPAAITGTVFILYALVIYPVLGMILGHTYPDNPTFGLPCPTTIFTFGILLWAVKKVPVYLVAIPFLWSIVGMSAALNIKVYEDLGLIVAGIAGLVLILLNNKKLQLAGGK
ncbi:MAG TPA: DUF6064 family protein [Ignavibacteriaceae bacterium]|nr:DUF6064 family protein [Ignavibacteriaceae bacterium]